MLINVGNGLINDTAQNLVWTRDANLAATNTFGLPTGTNLGAYPGDSSGATGIINADGTMIRAGARFWIDAMNAANYLGYHDWRLAAITDIGSDGCNVAYTGTDCGYNVNTKTGELASMWYETLGNIAYCNTAGSCPQSGWGLSNVGPFVNMKADSYWSGTEYSPYPLSAWGFDAGSGIQFPNGKDYLFYGWAVRPGQVAAAPLPPTGLLVALGLTALGAGRRGRRATLVIR